MSNTKNLNNLNYGIIGCGMMGQEHIKNIQQFEDITVSLILEPDQPMVKETEKLFTENNQPKFTSSLDSFFSEDRKQPCDAVIIASPNYLHVEQLLALKKYCREYRSSKPLAILVEKPVVTNSENFKKLEALTDNHFLLWVGMEYRYMPPIAKLIELAIPENIGELAMLTIREHRFPFLEKVNDWNRHNKNTGGTLVEKCCHFFDLMRLIMGEEAVEVLASGGQFHNHLDEVYETPSDIWDHAYTIVNFPKQKKALLELCMFAEGSHYQEYVSVVGTKGKVECFVPGPQRFWQPSNDANLPPQPKVVFSPRNHKGYFELETAVEERVLEIGDHNGATYFQHQLFLAALQNHKKGLGFKSEVTLKDGIAACRIGLAAQKSAIKKQTIYL